MRVMKKVAGIVVIGFFLNVIDLVAAVPVTQAETIQSAQPIQTVDSVPAQSQPSTPSVEQTIPVTIPIIPAATPVTTQAQSQTMQPEALQPVAINQPAPAQPLMPSSPVTATGQLNTHEEQKATSIVSGLPTTKEEKINTTKSPSVKSEKNEEHDGQVDEVDGQIEDKDLRDTVDSKTTSGNWVYKNYWWRKIEELYSSIKEAFNQVMTTRMTFFTKRNEVDKELDRFYQHVGLEQGPLEDIINLGIAVIEKEKKDQGFLDKKERIFFDKIKDKQSQLEQLKADVKAVVELDHKIDEALEVVLQQIDICSKYEQEAWAIFKNVVRELSDKEARKQYYDTKGLLQDINKVHEYLTGPFKSYFDQMTQSIQEHTQSIISRLAILKNDQLDLKREADFFEKEDESLEKNKVAEKHTSEDQKNVSTEKIGIIDQVFGSIMSLPKKMHDIIMSFFTKISELFVSSEKVVKTVESNVTTPVQKVEDVIQKTDQSVKKEVE